MSRIRLAAAFALASMFAICGSALARTIVVDDDRAQCPEAQFTSIQPAVDAAAPGDRIVVCPGTYREQVTIPSGKDFISLLSKAHWAAIIRAPETMTEPGDIVRVSGAQGVVIAEFTISGPLPDALFCSLTTRTGVRVDGGGSAEILGNHITEVRSTNPLLRGCQNGIAVLVGRTFEAQIGRATVVGNLIDLYQKGGVVVDNVGSSAFVGSNRVHGVGSTPDIAQNGIQISRGAHAQVVANEVADHTYSLANLGLFSSTGVLLFELAGGVNVSYNRGTRNDDNFGAYTTTDLSLTNNQATDSTFHDGFFFDTDTAVNRIRRNRASGNKQFDCHDESVGPGTAGTANFWQGDQGQKAKPRGICHGGEEGGDEED